MIDNIIMAGRYAVLCRMTSHRFAETQTLVALEAPNVLIGHSSLTACA